MGGSMSAVMLLLCYLPMTMIIIILPVVLYSMYTLIIVTCFQYTYTGEFIVQKNISFIMTYKHSYT